MAEAASNTLLNGTSRAETISITDTGLTGVTVDALAGNDWINNMTEQASINAGAGDDTIYNHYTTAWDEVDGSFLGNVGGRYSTLEGGAGNDSVRNSSDYVYISGGAGNDAIKNDGEQVTMNGGAGDDTIEVGDKIGFHHHNVVEYELGGGNDILINYNEDDTIYLVDGTIGGGYTGIGSNADDLILQVGEGTLTIKKGVGKTINIIDGEGNEINKVFGPMQVNNAEDGENIETEEFNDYIVNSGSDLAIDAGAGADYIYNTGDRVSIEAGAGNDTVQNTGERVTINGSSEDDYINNEGINARINAGAGADSIVNYGAGSTINAGGGDDTISVKAASRILYASGDGNDVLVGFDNNSTIKLTSGSIDDVENDGLDVVLKIGSGSLTIKDGFGKTIRVIDADGNASSISGGSFTKTNYSNDTIFNGTSNADNLSNSGSNVTISGGNGNDTIVNEGDNVSISGGAGHDLINDQSWGSTTVKGGAGNDTVIFANDAGHVIEFGASDGRDVVIGYGETDSIKLTSDVELGEPESDGTDLIFTVGSGTLTIKDGYGKKITFIDSNGELISANHYGPAELNNLFVNRVVSGTDYDDTITNFGAGATLNGGAGNDYVDNRAENVRVNAGAGADTVYNADRGTGSTLLGGAGDDYIDNVADSVSIDAGAGNDVISNSGRKVTIKGGAGNDNITGSDEHADVYRFGAGDGNDVINNFGANDTIIIDSGSSIRGHGSVEGGDYVITVASGSTVGTITLKDVNAASNKFTVSGSSFAYRTATAEDYYIPIYNDADNTVINLTQDERYFVTNAGERVTIQGGSKDDTFEGSETYGEVFAFGAGDGNDVILNFQANDTLRALSGKIVGSTVSGDDFIVSLSGGGSASIITLKNAANLTFKQSANNLNLTATAINPISIRQNDTLVAGTDAADSIRNFTGLNITIQGGGSNDTIYASNNSEAFEFGAIDGHDVIWDFGEDDTIKITQGEFQSGVKDTLTGDQIIYVKGVNASGSITLKDVGAKEFVRDGQYITVKQTGLNPIYNRTLNTLVSGTDKNDWITNSGSNVTIQANGGNDLIEGSEYAETFVFAPTHGEDTIVNFGHGNDTIRATSGTISTMKSGSDVLVSVKSGDNINKITLKEYDGSMLKKSGSNILYYNGINTIINTQPKVRIATTGGRDSVNNSGANVTLVGSAGNDTFTGSDYAELYLLASNHNNNVITNFGKGDSISMTAGQTITYAQSGNHVLVTLKGTSYTGVETLRNVKADKLKLKDKVLYYSSVETLTNDKDNTLFAGTTEDDYIVNTGNNVTIQANAGNDTIETSSNKELFDFSSADGNNLILNFGKEDSLRMTAGKTITYAKSGNDMIVTLKGTSYTGIETLEGAGDYKFALSSNGKILYVNEIATLPNSRNNYKFNGTSNSEYMSNTGYNVTIEPKAGDDTIKGSDVYGEWINFNADGGNNVIENFGENDSIRALSGTISTAISGDNAIVSIKSGSSISKVTLVGAKDYDFVRSSDKKLLTVRQYATIINDNDNVRVAGKESNDLIYNSGQNVTIQTGDGNDTIEASEYYGELFQFSSADGNNIITNFGVNDTLQMTAGQTMTFATVGNDVVVTLKGTSYTGIETLQGAAGLNLKKSSNGKYLAVDGVNYKLNRNNNKLVSGTDGRDYIESTGYNVTLDGKGRDDTLVGSDAYGDLFLFSSADGNDVIANFASNDTIQVTGGRIDAHYRNGSDYVVNVRNNAYAGSITLKDAGNLDFIENGNFLTVNKKNNYIVNRFDNTLVSGTDGADYITNSGQNVTIQGNRGNDTLEGSNFGELFNFSSADGDNVITNFGANDTLKMIAGTSLSVATVGSDVVATLKGKSYTGHATLLGAAGLNLKKSGLTLYGTTVNQLVNTQSNIKFNGTGGNDYMVNSGQNVTISSGAGNDTVEASSYAELFQFASNQGKNVVFGFGADDSLQMTAGNSITYKKSGTSTIVTLKGTSYTGTVTLRNTSAYDFVVNGKYLTVDRVNNISNSDDKKLVEGTEGRDYIVNSGQNVTIQAGPGADTIEGSAFGEMFDLSSADGNNLITNFGANDTLRMTAGKSLTFKTVGDDVIVTLKGTSYTGIETLQGAAGLNFKKTSNGKSLYVSGVTQKLNTSNNTKVTGTGGADYIINTGNNVTVQSNGGKDTITGSDVYGEVFAFSSADGQNVITNFGTNDTLKMTAGLTISYAADDKDYVVTLAGKSYTGTVRLLDAASIGTLRTSSNGKSVMLWANDSNSQLAAETEDYWFEQTIEQPIDEINSILSIENNSIDFEFDPSEQFKQSELDRITSARNEKLKK